MPIYIVDQLGGFGSFVKIVKIILNCKCILHQSRFALNDTDSNYKDEVSASISKVWPAVIVDKKL